MQCQQQVIVYVDGTLNNVRVFLMFSLNSLKLEDIGNLLKLYKNCTCGYLVSVKRVHLHLHLNNIYLTESLIM